MGRGAGRRHAGHAGAHRPASGRRCPSPSAAASRPAASAKPCPKEAIWRFSPFVLRRAAPLRLADVPRASRSTGRSCSWRRPIALRVAAAGDPATGGRPGIVRRSTPSNAVPDGDGLPRRRSCASRPRSRSGTTPASSTGSASRRSCSMKARIDALTNQINPHFLFNTLASISSLVRTKPETARDADPEAVEHAAPAAAARRSHFVPLREELASVDEYLDIEVVRFGPQLDRREGRSAPTRSTASCPA
ncbi:MAG: histidine kinase [Ignavibacteriales bacterium]|nr:histidine kinase [Ignavibacteriales bacterium]